MRTLKINISDWYLIQEDTICYAERTYQTNDNKKKRKERFKDWNGHDLSLSGEVEWAEDWIIARNAIDKINHF